MNLCFYLGDVMIFSNLLQHKEILIENIKIMEKDALSEIAELCEIKSTGKSKVSQKPDHDEQFTQNDDVTNHGLSLIQIPTSCQKWKLHLNLSGYHHLRDIYDIKRIFYTNVRL